jgi:small subunit ribosomal protein S2
MLDSGIHFGHHCSRWNPKMKPFIYTKRNAIHIIDIRETLRGILRAQRFLARVVARGEDVLFVGTKRQARDPIQQAAERCGMHYVNERWLGGTLTNFRTIRSRLQRLEELEALAQSPQWETGYSKKMKAMLLRELEKIRRNLSGIRKMTRLPGALLAIDVRKEVNALREARALGIPTVCLIDTDSDPDYVSIPIPGNDDAMRAIQFVCSRVAEAIEEAKRSRPEPRPQAEAAEGEAGVAPRRRPRRGARSEAPSAAATEGAAVLAAAEEPVEGEAVPGFEPTEGEPATPAAE